MDNMRKCIDYNHQDKMNAPIHLRSVKMTHDCVEIIAKWDFGPGYELYNIDEDFEVMQRFLIGDYYAVLNGESLIGFYCTGIDAQMDIQYDDEPSIIDFGCALNPEFIGQKMGKQLLDHALTTLAQQISFSKVRITVWRKNHRGLQFFIKYGFKIEREHFVNYDGQLFQFYVLTLIRSKV